MTQRAPGTGYHTYTCLLALQFLSFALGQVIQERKESESRISRICEECFSAHHDEMLFIIVETHLSLLYSHLAHISISKVYLLGILHEKKELY